jgi:2-C-methyl-D-erythritol 2,4-cyclodiphosphate synthase
MSAGSNDEPGESSQGSQDDGPGSASLDPKRQALRNAVRDAMRDAMREAVRIGNGFDTHALVEGRRLMLGGVHVPYDRGLQGHSDADALLHAVCDAVLGALGRGDIGRHFPDNDARFAGIDSRELLRSVWQLALTGGYVLGNLDATIVAQAPKLAPYVDTMRANLAADLMAPVERVNVKATTTDRLGFAGRGEGISALATVLLIRS